MKLSAMTIKPRGDRSTLLVYFEFMPYKDIGKGGYFGEIEIIKRCVRLFTSQATENTELLTLSKNIFEEYIKQDYPEVYIDMVNKAEKRLKKIYELRKNLK